MSCPNRSLLLALAAMAACRSVHLEADPATAGNGGTSGHGGFGGMTDGGSGGIGGEGGIAGIGGEGGLPGNDVPGPAVAHRLSMLEYRNTVQDLVGYTIPANNVAALLHDFSAGGFPAGEAIVRSADVTAVMAIAEGAARAAVQNLPPLLVPACTPVPMTAPDQDLCASRFISDFGLRAFRRPLTTDEANALHTVYLTERGPDVGGTFEDGIRVLITAMLQAPPFLYRWERGPAPPRDGALVRFDSYEIASRLSYLFWATMPDATLFAAAANDQLTTPEQIAVQARRLLADPHAATSLDAFHAAWLEYDDLAEVPKDPSFSFTPQLAQSMLDESHAFVRSLFLDAGATGKLDALFTSSSSFVDGSLASFYGIDSPGPLHAAALPPSQRAGILTQASFLARHAWPDRADPAMRGAAVLNQVLCIGLPELTNVVIPPVPELMPNVTNRQSFESIVGDKCASACHELYEAGYAFEHYDAIGAWRTLDAGQPIDASGTIHLTASDLHFADALELVRGVAVSDELRTCVGRQWLRYLTRRLDVDGDGPSLAAAQHAFAAADFDVRALLVALTKTRAFTHRSPSLGEVLP